MRLPIFQLAAALAVFITSFAHADSPRQLMTAKVQMGSETSSALCSVAGIKVLRSSVRIKCHDYPAWMFAAHNAHHFYMLPFKGQRRMRVGAIMDVLMFAREHSENTMLTYGSEADELPNGCDPDNCRILKTVGLVE